MAIVAGLTVYELGMLAAGAITALWLASPPGQKATRQAAEDVADAIDRIKSKATERTIDLAPPIPKTECPEDTKKKCPPCPPPPPPQIHRVPPSTLHDDCPGDHWHYFVYNQNPQTCVCYLQRKFGGCLEQGGFPPGN